MYHCHVHFHLVGIRQDVFAVIEEMSPLPCFTHEFTKSERAGDALTGGADVILADLRDMDVRETVCALTADRGEDTELILLAEKEQIPLLTRMLDGVKDIWTLPMSGEEIRFHFLRWQQAYKMGKDYWQTSHFLEATINNVPNLIWYKDKDGVHEKVNDSFCRTVGKTKQKVEGQRHAYIWDVEEDDPACIESERQVMEKEQTFVSEERVKAGDGIRLLTTYKSPLYDIDGSVMGTVGVAIDVTQERAYEQEIIQKNRTLETIFNNIECGVMYHSVDGSKIISVNQAALDILGYDSLDEMAENGFYMIASSVMEEDREELLEKIRGLQEEGDSVSVEYRVRRKDGAIRYVMGNVKLMRENDELRYQRFVLDCTDRKLQEEENERQQMELVQALSIDYKVVCFFDLETGIGKPLRVEEVSQQFKENFAGELSFEESMEFYIQKYVCEEDREMVRQAASREEIEKGLSEGKQYHVNFRTQKKGQLEYYQMKIVRAGVRSGRGSIVLGIRSVDKEIRNEMEQRSNLKDALMQANRASKAKSVFLSNMSHDIRTPMNAIVGFTSLAMKHIDNRERMEEYLKKIMTSGNHLLSLINDVLDMSRIESGKIRLDEKACSLPEILHSICNIVQADVHAKQLELHIDTLDIRNEDIYCDKLRLNQVLLNLLGNAVKYTGAGGAINMRITEKAGAPDGFAQYEFSIKDNGVGMSDEFVEHIFEPFEREKNSTTSGIQGTGLGMAITKNIVDMMNGTIEVESELGVGSTFTVSFVFRTRKEEKEEQAIPELKNCRALVVDDDFNTCDSVSYMLGQIGLRAEWTLSGKEAVLRTKQASMRKDGYLVYIIDWLLPDMNGIEVTRRVRQVMGDNVPVIVLTAYDWSEIEEEAKEAGVTAFCSKPLFMSELRKCLRTVIGAEEQVEEEKEGREVQFKAGRILLAEDNELNQEIAVEILGGAGFTTEVAENGKVALEMLQRSDPGYYQLVLMDVQMPVMSGYEAVREIRQLENQRLAGIPVIAMTANAFEEDKQEALRNGMDGHIAKPINIELLFTTLNKVLSREKCG
ncbi:MAG: response regulator [Lachnospiraceae bacterium]|jgi:PAS domain S-box-containing protein|nr:response regulator [Lachnospiraceae bacterium]